MIGPFSKTSGLFAKVVEITGDEIALKICEELGGLVLAIPRAGGFYREQRDAAIRADYDQGVKVPGLARKHHLTSRQIYNILGKADPEPRKNTIKEEE
jgi:Mor family transcriptional regulator